MRVIGTAGHVDHGKSTLIEALTGIHPDRLKEEREREMTIDLGFAWLALPAGEEIGIVDVPGHRDFIENMLAGIGGIDAALFVIAADEGIMPQTREHLSILDILQVPSGVVALTKIDLVDDPEWLDLVEDEVRQALGGTVLEQAPIVRVSARTRQGLDDLTAALEKALAASPERLDTGKPRLPVDRVFTIAGFGTVVTGTLSDGCLRLGEEIEILPEGRRGRVRGLQTHKRKEESAVPGSRTAVNISGVTVEQVKRGDVLTHPGDYRSTRRMDVRFRLLPDASAPLAHNTSVKLFIGASEILARLRLLGYEELPPGEAAWLQLELEAPVAAVRGDRYILRRPSPGETLGGGVVVDPFPSRRYKRFSGETLDRLQALSQGTPAEVLEQSLNAAGLAPLSQAIARSGLDSEAAAGAVKALVEGGSLVNLEAGPGNGSEPGKDSLVAGRGYWAQTVSKIIAVLEAYHHDYPLKKGISREELKSRMKLPARSFNAVMHKISAEGQVVESGPLVALPAHRVHFTPKQSALIQELMQLFDANPNTPPSVKESQEKVGAEVYEALVEAGELVQVSPEVVFSRQAFERMTAELKALIQAQGTVSAAQVRDHFDTSRKYALAFLEYLDASGVTLRQGDVRRLKK